MMFQLKGGKPVEKWVRARENNRPLSNHDFVTMAQYQIFLLPLLALALALLFPLFDKDLRQSTSLRSRRRRRILLGRFTVVALLFATLVTEIWPLDNMMPLVQGLVITGVLVFVARLVLWGLSKFAHKERDDMAVRTKQPSQRRPSNVSAMSLDVAEQLPDTRADVMANAMSRMGAGKARVGAGKARIGADKDGMRAVKEDDVQEQLERVSDIVQSYDLDDSGYTLPGTANAEDKARKKRDQLVSASTGLMISSTHPTDLAKLDNNQITQLVTTLRKDKKRLQKLVLAQQAAIETERHAHEKTRVLTRDAISVMRSARTAQKTAEKMARRERAERQRLEQQYKKVAFELSNAMSIVEKRKAAEASNESLAAHNESKLAEKILF